jgi:hypothetical protein
MSQQLYAARYWCTNCISGERCGDEEAYFVVFLAENMFQAQEIAASEGRDALGYSGVVEVRFNPDYDVKHLCSLKDLQPGKVVRLGL